MQAMTSPRDNRIHATCVALGNSAVLLTGAPGCGKSDLAMQLIDRGAQLVSDDQVKLNVKDGLLLASAPQSIKGLLEIRGIGIVRCKPVASCVVTLALELTPGVTPERLPDSREAFTSFAGSSLPYYQIDPREASAAAKVRFLLEFVRQERTANTDLAKNLSG